jgi:hypothetical protein
MLRVLCGLQTKISYAYEFFTWKMHTTYHAHLMLFEFIYLIIVIKEQPIKYEAVQLKLYVNKLFRL